MECKKCGFVLEENDKFCPQCGSKVQRQKKVHSSSNKPDNHKFFIGIVFSVASIALICFIAMLIRDSLGVSIDGKYYECEDRYYLKTDLDLTADETNYNNEWIERKRLTGSTIILNTGTISSSEFGNGVTQLNGNYLICDIEGSQYYMNASNGKIYNIRDKNNEVFADGWHRWYIRDDTDEYKELVEQKQNKIFPRQNDIPFEIVDEKGTTVLCESDVMMLNEGWSHPDKSYDGVEGEHRWLQIDFLYDKTEYLKQFAGQSLYVMYYGNAIYSFVLEEGDMEPFLSIAFSYGDVTSIPALDDLIDILYDSDEIWQ